MALFRRGAKDATPDGVAPDETAPVADEPEPAVEDEVAPVRTGGPWDVEDEVPELPRVDLGAVRRSLLGSPGQLAAIGRSALDAARAFRALSRARRRLGAGLGYPNLGELLLDVA